MQDYAKNISEELPFDKSVFKIIVGSLAALILFLILPQFLSGKLDVSTPRLIYYGLTILMIPLLLYVLLQLVRKYGDQKKTYVLAGLVGVLSFLLMIGGEFFLQHYIKAIPVKLDNDVSFYIGLTIGLIGLAVCIYLKQWLFVFVIIAVSIPDIAARLATNGAVESKDYAMIAATVSTVCYTLFLMGTVIFVMRSSNETLND